MSDILGFKWFWNEYIKPEIKESYDFVKDIIKEEDEFKEKNNIIIELKRELKRKK